MKKTIFDFNLKNKRVLSISAHPDDEVGGAGGFLLQAQKQGAKIHLVLAIDPGEERREHSFEEERQKRLKEFEKVGTILHAQTTYLGFPRYVFPSVDRIRPLIKVMRKFRPDIVLTLSDEERHIDHRAVATLTKKAIWHSGRNIFPEYGKPFRTQLLLQYEADNPMQDITFLRDISDVAEKKRALITLYASQMQRKDLAEASLSLNRFRGLMFKSGTYSESFKANSFFYG
jgi:LmbE family N-acetylglucosaminyl deacetylase